MHCEVAKKLLIHFLSFKFVKIGKTDKFAQIYVGKTDKIVERVALNLYLKKISAAVGGGNLFF